MSDDRPPTDAERAFGALAMVQDEPLYVPEATLKRGRLPDAPDGLVTWPDGSRLRVARTAKDWRVEIVREGQHEQHR